MCVDIESTVRPVAKCLVLTKTVGDKETIELRIHRAKFQGWFMARDRMRPLPVIRLHVRYVHMVGGYCENSACLWIDTNLCGQRVLSKTVMVAPQARATANARLFCQERYGLYINNEGSLCLSYGAPAVYSTSHLTTHRVDNKKNEKDKQQLGPREHS